MQLYQNSSESSSFPVASPLFVPSHLTTPLAPGARLTSEGVAGVEDSAHQVLVLGGLKPVSDPLFRDSLGKEHELTSAAISDTSLFNRLEKYELQRIAADILEPFGYEGHRGKNAGKLQPPRVCKCLQVPRKPDVEVWKSVKHDKHFYGGLVICGSAWDCLPCASKISERRRIEIKQAIDIWTARGGSVHMLTLTFPHYEHQKTKPLLAKFSAARRLMRKRLNWKQTSDALSLVGSINRNEITYGGNGAHIHCHELLFSEHTYLTIAPGCFYPMWAAACMDSGLDAPSEAHGVAISSPKEMADYVSKIGKEASKWTIELEMTKGHIKRGKVEGMTPFDLLRAYRDTGDCDFADRFVEYSQAFKGKTQIKWSRGLRELLNMKQGKTDEEIAKEMDDTALLASQIDHLTWAYIRKYNQRGQLIEAFNRGGVETAISFINSIKRKGK